MSELICAAFALSVTAIAVHVHSIRQAYRDHWRR